MEIPIQCITPEQKLEFLSKLLRITKASEEQEKKNRIALEEVIADFIPGPERGSKTVTLKDGTKITVERGFNYKADIDAIERMDLEYKPIKIKTTRELDVTGYEWWKENNPVQFLSISQHVQVTPKKIFVSISAKK